MLEFTERQDLTTLLSELYDFTDGGARARRLLLQQSGLNQFLTGIDLTGAPRTVAADILSRIEDYGPLKEAPTKHSLGALLAYLLTLPDLAGEKKTFVAKLIVKFSLISDPVYVEKLRADYSISEAAVPPPPTKSVAPVVSTVSTSEPAFTVEMPNQAGLEEIINSEDNFLDISWLYGALYCAQAICRIEIPEETAKGTGFLVGPSLLLTNQHVLKSVDYVKEASVRFDYRVDTLGIVAGPGRTFRLDPDIYYSSKPEELDYALVGIKGEPLKEIATPPSDKSLMDLVLAGKHRGFLVMRPEFIKENDRVNIIQHPDGRPMKAVMTQNYVTADMRDSRVQYVADTMGGSSGSPVFNRKWEVVALHHSGKPYPPEEVVNSKKDWKGRWRTNEGIPIRAILEDLKDKDLERLLPRS